jgi:hypothetical protein
MTTPRALIGIGSAAMALLLTVAALPARAWADGAATLLYERTLMDRAGARCRLFTPEIASALAAAAAQARGAALRGGTDPAAVREIQARAASKADAAPCASHDLAVAADRVRKAFDGYAALREMTFPGALSTWRADRKPWPLVRDGKVRPGPRWRLWEAAEGGAAVVGLTTGTGFTAVTALPGARQAFSARLLLRDPAKAADAVIDPRRRDLAGRTPPRWVTQAFIAQAIGPAPESLLAPGAGGGVMAVFPPEAAKALAALDPREGAVVEFASPAPDGERVQTALFEVGDFAAGRAFLAAGR